MKKAIVLAVVISILSFTGAVADTAEPFFSLLSGVEWSFSSGAGGWSTDLRILPDGSFSGEYHDSEMGEFAEDYPNGTVYCCSFHGRMSMIEQTNDSSWRIRVENLDADQGQDAESIDDGIRFVFAEPYGISEGDEMILYRPGTSVNGFTEDMLMWAHLPDQQETGTTLENWFLYSSENESGFVGFPPDPDDSLANSREDLTA